MPRMSILLVICVLAAPAFAFAQQSDEPEAAPPNLAGTWAQQVVTTAISDVPIVGEVVTRTVSLQKVDIAQTGPKLQMTTEVCDIQVHSSVDVIETKIPKRFVAAMGVVKRPAKLVERDGKFEFRVPQKYEVLGVKLRVPKSEHLPTGADDPRIYDQDKDGKPGMTVRVSGLIDGSLYIVHRGWDRLLGTITGKNRIAGKVQWDLEQVVVDSTSVFLGNPPDSRAHPDASKNHFRMRRVNKGADCQTILQRRASLF